LAALAVSYATAYNAENGVRPSKGGDKGVRGWSHYYRDLWMGRILLHGPGRSAEAIWAS
jgi:hypothetical protein